MQRYLKHREQEYDDYYENEDYEEEVQGQDEEPPYDLPWLTKAGLIAAPGIPLAIIELLAHGGATPVALTGFGLAFLSFKASPWLVERLGKNERVLLALSQRDDLRIKLDALTNGHFTNQILTLQEQRPELFDDQYLEEPYQSRQKHEQYQGETKGDNYNDQAEAEMREMEALQPRKQAKERMSIARICRHIERNSYILFFGSSLTREYQAVGVSFWRQHIKIIGTSQRGKSSMAAIILTIIAATHDSRSVQFALLDQENITSRLFADLPHVATWRGVKLHAQNAEQVVDSLSDLVDMMEYRYTLPTAERKALPLVLMYLEEFLDLKNELKQQIKLFAGEGLKAKRDRATKQYAQFMLAINRLALRGLKANMQFLLCAHTDYADEDFRDALSQFGIGLSFCAKPTAAQAAGFTEYDLLSSNSKQDQAGTAVIEAPGVADLLLAPTFDLDACLIDLESRQARQWNVQNVGRLAARPTPETPRSFNDEAKKSGRPDAQMNAHPGDFEQDEALAGSNVRTFPQRGATALADQPDATSDARSQKRIPTDEIQAFVSAYRACRNQDKALATLSKGTDYRAHAREIIQALDLR